MHSKSKHLNISLVFKTLLEYQTLNHQTHFNRLKSGLVRYSDPYCNALGYPPVSEVSNEVENFIKRKNTPACLLCQRFFCLSVTNFDPNYLWTGKIAQKYLPRLAPLAGDMNFAIQISPLPNLAELPTKSKIWNLFM